MYIYQLIQLLEVGYWINHNNCETGECNSDGQFIEIVIDCEVMYMRCLVMVKWR